MPLYVLTSRNGKTHMREMTEQEMAEIEDRPLPWRVRLAEGSSERYNAVYGAQQKFFAANGQDRSPAQVRKFWEQYKSETGASDS